MESSKVCWSSSPKKKQLSTALVAGVSGQVQGSLADALVVQQLLVDVSAGIEKETDGREETSLGSEVEGGLTVGVHPGHAFWDLPGIEGVCM